MLPPLSLRYTYQSSQSTRNPLFGQVDVRARHHKLGSSHPYPCQPHSPVTPITDNMFVPTRTRATNLQKLLESVQSAFTISKERSRTTMLLHKQRKFCSPTLNREASWCIKAPLLCPTSQQNPNSTLNIPFEDVLACFGC
jgi:hypothetical protein